MAGSDNPFEQQPLPDFTEARARIATQVLFGLGALNHPLDEEELHHSLEVADAILLGSISLTLAAQEAATEGHVKHINEILGPPTPTNTQEKL